MNYNIFIKNFTVILLFIMFGLTLNCILISEENEDYQKILFKLGAIPLTQIDKKHWDKFKDYPSISMKGFRLDINGWISPFRRKRIESKLKNEEKVFLNPQKNRSEIIEWYQKYKSLLNTDKYKIEKNPLHFAIMYFLIEIQFSENLALDNKGKLIEIAEAGIGLEELIVNSLRSSIDFNEAIRIYLNVFPKIISNNPEYIYIDFMPMPKKEDLDYIIFLENSIQNMDFELYSRWYFLFMLYKLDESKYRSNFIDFTLENIKVEKNEKKRMRMYVGLIKTGDEKVLKQAGYFIGHDSYTFCRINILNTLCEIGYVDKAIVNSIYEISLGRGKRHKFICIGCDWFSWGNSLIGYLQCIKDSKSLSKGVRKKALKSLSTLIKFKHGSLTEYLNYFNIDLL